MQKCNLNPSKIPTGTIHSIISLLQNALKQLGAPLDNNTIENIGILVYQVMKMQNRSFHTPEHIFDLTDGEDPHLALAAIFHDLVYYQVDNGFHNDIESILTPYLLKNGDEIKLRNDIALSDRALYGTAAIFGFSPGQSLLPYAGLNEFLSALVMNSLLEGLVKDSDLLVATAAIEMTIPFRSLDDEGRTPADRLKSRIIKVNEQFALGLSESKINQAVISAVTLANRDINNFAEEDSARFLDNTWKLLPESNPELFVQGVYSIKSYAEALRKMEGFLSFLKPEIIFQQFGGYPEKSEYLNLLNRAYANLAISGKYLGIKMVSAGILQAIAVLSGGDAPMSFFMGDINHENDWCKLTYYLPEIKNCADEKDENSVLYQLFKIGRFSSSDFDLKNSPLSLFIYCSVDEDNGNHCIDLTRDYLNDKMDAQTYLQSIPGYIVSNIAKAASYMAFTRCEVLQKLADSFS